MKKAKIYWDERGIMPQPAYYRVMLKQVILAGLEDGQSCEISISLVSPEEIRNLNNQYRQKDTATDVLSFLGNAQAGHSLHPPHTSVRCAAGTRRSGAGINSLRSEGVWGRSPHLNGDIIICPDVAVAQAAEYGHSLDRELAFLTAHGLLHLQGYDHNTPENESEMINRQNEILTEVGIQR